MIIIPVYQKKIKRQKKIKWPLVILVTFLLSLFSINALSGETAPATAGESAEMAGYLIGAGDVLEILVWKEPDISRTVSVRPDGKISIILPKNWTVV